MSDPWTDFETQCLYDVVNDIYWFDQARQHITERSPGAIRTKMARLREEAGITPTRGLNAIELRQLKSVTASRRLADAINELRELEAV